MNKKKAMMLSVSGAIMTLLSSILIVIGTLEAIESSQYQNIGLNIPMVILVGAIFIGGIVVLIKGIRELKSTK